MKVTGLFELCGDNMKPSRILRIYYLTTLSIGIALSVPVAHFVHIGELGVKGSAILTLCWNVLFVMLLPLIMDWAESIYFKARFVQLEEVAKTNPELAELIAEQCKKLSIPGFRFAVVDNPSDETFSYGLWRSNPRLVVSESFLTSFDKTRMVPSVERELTRFATQDHTFFFLFFTVMQIMLQYMLIAFHVV